MNNAYEQDILAAKQAYSRQGGIEPINGVIPVPWRSKKDLALWLLYLAYIFPLRASAKRYTHDQIADLVQEDWGMSRPTYYNYLSIIRERGWLVPSHRMTQWEQMCYLNGPQRQQESLTKGDV